MLGDIYNIVSNPQVLFATFAAIAVFATIITASSALFERDRLAARIKTVAIEREKIRARERARLADTQKRASLRNEAKPFMRQIVDRFNLKKALADDKTTSKLRMAGYRGNAPLVIFLFARLVLPLIFFVVAMFYLFAVMKLQQPAITKILIAVVFAYVGFYAPNLYVSNVVQKRRTSIRRAWPDALDLMLICVESGMSAEAAFRRVSEEIGAQSVELAEELTLTTAELSYLQERRQAYERYGTPIGQSLRVLAQENRDQRMNNAEKKAAALPPKLTVPMILFFLPVLFGVIIGPAAINVTHTLHH